MTMTPENGGEQVNKLTKKYDNLRLISDTFASYGGILAKVAQIVNIISLKKEDSCFSECKTFNSSQTIEYIHDEILLNPDVYSEIKTIDYRVYKAGSIGQIHRGTLHSDNREIIFKVQYVDIDKQFATDLTILNTLTNYLYHKDMYEQLQQLGSKLMEELDFFQELKNQQIMHDIWKDDEVILIPQPIPLLSSKKILCMEFIEGETLSEFSSCDNEDRKQFVAWNLMKFVFENIYKHGIFYSDVHYGNFIVTKDDRVCVVDFGSLIHLDKKLHHQLIELHRIMIRKDKEDFYRITKEMEIYDESTISVESYEYLYKYFEKQFEPWTSKNFRFTEEWFEDTTPENVNLMNEWLFPKTDLLYFTKIPYSTLQVFTTLGLHGNFLEYFTTLL